MDGSYGFGYGAEGLRLNMTIPRLALGSLAFDGKDKLFHASAQAERFAGQEPRTHALVLVHW